MITEIITILVSVLIPPPEPTQAEPNLATAINHRFAEIGGVELPEISREPIRNPSEITEYLLSRVTQNKWIKIDNITGV